MTVPCVLRSENYWTDLIVRYAVSIIMTALAIQARYLLAPFLADECPFSFFYLSVLATAWIAGTGPAVLAIAAGSLAAAHLFIEPASSLWIDNFPDLLQLLIYVLVNVVATLLFSRLHSQRMLAEQRVSENLRLSQSLREADERKNQFLALLAHELRNPLAPIRTSLTLLQQHGQDSAPLRRVEEVIRRQTDHLVRITNDLLDVSRLRNNRVALKVESVSLKGVIGDATAMVEDLMISKAQHFRVLCNNASLQVNCDPVRLTQILANLLSNAVKYTPCDGRITLQVTQYPETLELAVVDSGIGFSPEDANRLLEPFTQIDMSRTREYGGLGVGLAIVKHLVELHGGQLKIESRGPGLGSRFTVWIPNLAPAALEVAPPRNFSPTDPSAASTETVNDLSLLNGQPGDTLTEDPTLDKPSILVVDDNQDAADILAELLIGEGYSVEVAYDGIDALQKAHSQQPRLVILDIGLPSMDGYEVARCLRRDCATEKSVLIALTGWGTDADRQLAADAGFDRHFVKPIVFSELLHTVRETTASVPAVALA